MATEKWIAGSGAGFTWTDAFTGSTLNSLSSGNSLVGLSLDNTSALDIYAAVSIHLASAAFVAPNWIGLGLYPLNAGAPGTVYGDGRFGSAASGAIPAQYVVGQFFLVPLTQAQDAIIWNLVIPPNKFKFILYNQGGVALASSGNTCQYTTYNRSIA